MSLEEYQNKRKFSETPEPEGEEEVKSTDLIFVVQKHHASHLHFDFRIEAEGVLKSWAVPKGPSMNPSDKRLAVMVEDHPIEYATFQGIIPEGNYGAGSVEIWDSGIWKPTDKNPDVIEALNEGHLEFTLKGEKLEGLFVLIKTKGEKAKNGWLLIKKKDNYATSDVYDATKI